MQRQLTSTRAGFGSKMTNMVRTGIILSMLLAGSLLAGCAATAPQVNPPASEGFPATPTTASSPSPTALPNPTASPSPTDPISAATALPAVAVCSPLQDIPLARISEIISNPYQPPRPGSDDPHHGVDLADLLPGSQVAVAGRAVQAALAGQVAAIIQDRFPYGSAVLIETPLEDLQAGWQEQVGVPTTAPTLAPVSPLTCPPAPEPFTGQTQRSLYLLYAHLQQPTTLRVEEPVACGQTIGAVGNSGNALNPHLHFEARVGPAGLRLASMAHYDSSASPEEMSSYCLWRISGWFQLVDPLQVLLAGLK